MRSIPVVAFLCLSAVPVQAADLLIVCPPLVQRGMTEMAAAYAKQTGIGVTVRSNVMGQMLNDIRNGTPAPDVVVLPPDLMATLAKDNGVKPGTLVPLGRMEIGLAVRAGAPHPDISTVEKLRAALLGAKMIVYTRPGPPRNSMEAGIIDGLMHRPDFAGVHVMPVVDGSGVSALAKGDGDMAMQAVSAINAQKSIELVGPLPPELGAHVDTEAAVSARAADAAAAAALIAYMTRPEAAAEWKKSGLDR